MKKIAIEGRLVGSLRHCSADDLYKEVESYESRDCGFFNVTYEEVPGRDNVYRILIEKDIEPHKLFSDWRKLKETKNEEVDERGEGKTQVPAEAEEGKCVDKREE